MLSFPWEWFLNLSYNLTMRKMGLDLGAKSCGVALSDMLNVTAQGVANLTFEKHNWVSTWKQLEQYLENVDLIVLGYPLFPSGDKSSTTYMVEDFEAFLKTVTNLTIVRQNERYTTKRAHEIMIEAGLTRKKRKKFKDKLAAVLILQDYLDRVKNE